MKKFVWIFLVTLFISESTIGQKPIHDSLKTFRSLEKALKSPESVYHLDLSSSKLKSIPDEINQLTNLRTLKLSKNKLKELPVLDNLNHVREIELSKNKFTDFPESILGKPTLEVLDIGGNDIKLIPKQFIEFVNLKEFVAWGNDFTEIPEFLKEMTSLIVVDFRAMLFSYNEQQLIFSYFPKAEVLFDEGCDCDD